jgi:hypothetical protein
MSLWYLSALSRYTTVPWRLCCPMATSDTQTRSRSGATLHVGACCGGVRVEGSSRPIQRYDSSVWVPSDIFASCHPTEHQDRLHTALDASDDVCLHPVANHDRIFRVHPQVPQGRPHHERIRLANGVRFDPSRCGNHCRHRPARRHDAWSVGPAISGLVAIERAPAATSRIAVVMRSKLYETVSPRTT